MPRPAAPLRLAGAAVAAAAGAAPRSRRRTASRRCSGCPPDPGPGPASGKIKSGVNLKKEYRDIYTFKLQLTWSLWLVTVDSDILRVDSDGN